MGFKKILSILILSIILLTSLSVPVFAQNEDPSFTECREDLRDWREMCKSPEHATSSDCRIGKVCNKNGDTWRLEDAGRPYDIEYFDVTSSEEGLIAPGQASPSSSRFTDENGNRFLLNVVYEVVNVLTQMVSLFALIVFIVGTFFLITANGDDNQITKGKDAIKYSLMGLVFVLLSYTIVVFVQSIFF